MNLYCISSPLQLLAAIEAAERIPANQHVLLIRATNTKRAQHQEQMESLITFKAWDDILHWPTFNEKSIVGRLKATLFIRRFARKYQGQCSNFLFGGFGWVKNHSLRSLLDPDNVYLLDDGTATIHQHKEYLSMGVKLTPKVTRLYSERGIRSWLTGLFYPINKETINKPITIFTSFDVQPNESAGVFVLKHNFEALSKRATKKKYSAATAYYFGSPLSEKGLTNLADEVGQIASIHQHYLDNQVSMYYIPHRDDSTVKLEMLEDLGLEKVNLGMPAELYFATQDELPLHVASSNSTALHNVYRICGEVRPTLFSIISHIQKPEGKRTFNIVEDHYYSIGIPVLEPRADTWEERKTGTCNAISR